MLSIHKYSYRVVLDKYPSKRMRAHAILLSAEGKSINEIAAIYPVHRVSVASWITYWEQRGIVGLLDKERSGRPHKLTEEERERVRIVYKIFTGVFT